MSNAFLNKTKDGMMYCKCPKCGEVVYVYAENLSGTTSEGSNEYLVRCDDCGTWFNASVDF
jgi:uncharacterized C2H2 Zn-finger protein